MDFRDDEPFFLLSLTHEGKALDYQMSMTEYIECRPGTERVLLKEIKRIISDHPGHKKALDAFKAKYSVMRMQNREYQEFTENLQ